LIASHNSRWFLQIEGMNETKNPNNVSLTSGRVLARNTVANLVGQGVPLLVALCAIPLIVKGLGTERFGVLTLAWMVVGYFSLFDMGIGRATTKFVADHIARGESDGLPQLVWTSITMLFCFGVVGGLLLAALSPLLVSSVLKIPSHLKDETLASFYVLAAAIPVVLGTAGTRGILEAQQRFGLLNAIKVPISTASFAVPLLVLQLSHSLYFITAALLMTRIIEFTAYLLFCIKSIPGMKDPQWPKVVYINKLLGFGGWLTVTNIINPLMTYMDRFIIGTILTISAVAYYATPYDLVTKLWILSGSLLGVMFPALSASYITDHEKFTLLYERSMKVIMLVLAPIVLIIVLLAGPLMEFWLGHEFASHSTLVLQILAIGVFINSAAQVPYAAIQALGRPDLTAKLHLLELPLYLGAIVFSIREFGIVGAAIAWLLRVLLDTILLLRFSRRLFPENNRRMGVVIATLACVAALLCLSLALSVILQSLLLKLFLAVTLIFALLAFFWRISLDAEEKKGIMHLYTHLPARE
jgi:O-antigen/teichoic acid export membrane protein